MAKRRMFSIDITESDAFTDMPLTAQALYFHLGMNADDDGFVNSPKRIQRSIGASPDDLGLLIAKGFAIIFDSGVLLIKHWKINNQIQKDRYHQTKYLEEFRQVKLKGNGAYTLSNTTIDLGVYEADTECIHDVSKMETESSLGKVRLGKKDILSACTDIVAYLNAMTGKNFKPTSQQTQRRISARLSEGFSVDDFKAVIDTKVAQWKNDKTMAGYLRPETLFGTKFESYLNEKAVRKNDYSIYDR